MVTLNTESISVQSYLNHIQAVITRLASNSASCKTWCVTLVSAVIIFASDKNKPDSIWAAIIPIGLFFALDAYYLGLEREFRSIHNGFITKLHSGTATSQDLFIMMPKTGMGNILSSTVNAANSISVWPFYVLISSMLIVIRSWIF